MSELKKCPLCGAELKVYGPEDWKPTFYDPDSGGDPYTAVCDCGFNFHTNHYDYAEFVKAVNRRAQPEITGETSDGYHTFNELYHHRAVLFSVICNDSPTQAWKSKLHHDGTMYDGMFIVGVETPDGQATYHYDIEPYWDMFRVQELPQAPEWDGHTPAQAVERIGGLCAERESEPLTLEELRRMDGEPVYIVPINLHKWICDARDGKPEWGMVRKSWVRIWRSETADLMHTDFDFEDYGKIWLAYRRKPERSEKE